MPACCLILLSPGTEEPDGCTHGTEAVTLRLDVTWSTRFSVTDACLFRSRYLAVCDPSSTRMSGRGGGRDRPTLTAGPEQGAQMGGHPAAAVEPAPSREGKVKELDGLSVLELPEIF